MRRPAVVGDEDPSVAPSVALAKASVASSVASASKLTVLAELDVAYALNQLAKPAAADGPQKAVPRSLSRLSMAMAETQVRGPISGF